MTNSVNASKKQIPDNTTTRYLPFSQIKENVILLKDSSARVVLKCSTLNFLLKSQEEQDAIIMSYQRFLNSLDFPVQILIRSKKMDINWYLTKLNWLAIEQKNSLLQNQTYEYIEYLRKLIEVAQIMKKEFYIVVPFDFEENKSVRDLSFVWSITNFWWSINSWDDIVKIKSQMRQFTKLKKWLATRTNSIKTSLESIWIKAQELNKTELVNFLTDYYNPTMDNFEMMKWDIDNYNLI